MKHRLFILMILGLVSVSFFGCEDETEQIAPELSQIIPANGANNVSTETTIQVDFDMPMDTSSCQSRFGLFMGEYTQMPMHMNGRMHGEFHWNTDRTVMTFDPDSLSHEQMYSICIQEGMMAEDHQRGGMMNGGMHQGGRSVTGGMISTFTTK